ncbi:MAG: DUF58 domain-containing protein [Polyangiales bacterium]
MSLRAFSTLRSLARVLRDSPRSRPARAFAASSARVREVVPLTLRGAAVAALSGGALWYYGFEALDGVWYVAGLGLLALCALSLLSVLGAALRLKIWLAGRAASAPVKLGVETGRAVRSGFEAPALRFWLLVEPSLAVREPGQVEADGVRDGGLLREHLRFGDHGEVRRVARTLSVRDVFGLCSVGLREASAVELDVLPHAGALRALSLLRSLSGGDDVPHPLGIEQGDRLELKRYAPGDPARFIHWKVYARTQKLVVRMPERALSRAQRVAAYLVAGPGDAASAAAARVALEEGAFGADFRFGADGSPQPARDVTASLVALRRSSASRATSAVQLDAFLTELEREGPTSLVLFVPPHDGAWVSRIEAVLKRRARAARVVIGVDGIRPPGGASWLARLALSPAPSTRSELPALRELIARYRRAGCDVVVVDRESGRVLGDAHLAQRARPATREAA